MHRVFGRPPYLILALALAAIVFLCIMWLPSLALVSAILSDPAVPLDRAISLAIHLFASSFGDSDAYGLSYALTTSMLIGMNAALMMFYFRAYRAAPSSMQMGGGVIGAGAALLGLGCAACGSLALAAFAAWLGVGGIFLALPFQGAEIGLIGIFLMVLSAAFLARAINKPVVCPI